MVSDIPSEAGGGGLERFLRKATWRIRLERLRLVLGLAIRLLVTVAVGWTAAIYLKPSLALAAPVGLALAALLLLVAADAALFWRVERRQVWRRLDRQLGLADAVVSSTELGAETPESWRARQRAQTVGALETRLWAQLWPGRWPRFTGAATLVLLFFAGVLLLDYGALQAELRPVASPFLQAQFQAVEQVFKDWEQAQKKLDDPELRRLLEELKPLREQMASGALQERDAMVALSRVEEKLEAARRTLDAQSLESSAGEMAGALEPLENMSGLAAALRRKDFAQADKLAAEQATALAQPEAKLPQGAQDAANQQRMENLAKNLQERGQKSAGAAMQKMGQGMKEADGQEMGEGMKGLGKSLGDQAKRDAEKQRLGTQLAQMGQCKEGLGNGQSLARGMSLMPKLATEPPGGKGAGSDIDPNRFGAETQLASKRTEEKITGTAGEGDSQTTTEKTNEKMRETASGARAGNFQQYDKLSREAIDDENIPLAHRQAIRKYFELIRPAEK